MYQAFSKTLLALSTAALFSTTALAQKPVATAGYTVSVFAVFAVTYLGDTLRWNHLAAFACLALAGFFAFHKWT